MNARSLSRDYKKAKQTGKEAGEEEEEEEGEENRRAVIEGSRDIG